AEVAAAHIAAMNDELCDAFGMPARVSDRDRRAATDAHDRESFEPEVIHDRFHVGDVGIEGLILHIAIRQPRAALVEADERVVARQGLDPWSPDGTLRIELQVTPVAADRDEWRAATAYGVGDTHTVRYGTEADAILCGWHAIDSTSSKAMAL